MTSPQTSSLSIAPVIADFTFSFNCIPEVPIEMRFEAARDAGFVDVGLSVRWMKQWLQTHDLAELDEKLEQFDVRVAELEAIRVMGEEIDPLEDLAALLAEHLRPDRLQAVGPYSETETQAAVRAGRVADRFAQWNVDVVLEPLPFTNMKTPADAAHQRFCSNYCGEVRLKLFVPEFLRFPKHLQQDLPNHQRQLIWDPFRAPSSR